MKLSTLSTALHHTFLWFFTGSTTIAIVNVVSTLYGESVSSSGLATMIAVVFTTFVPYAVFFGLFLNSVKSQKTLKPTKAWHIWSIVTICIHSIAALGWATALLVALLIGGEASTIVGSLLNVLLLAAVAGVYGLLLHSKLKKDRRKTVVVGYLTVILLIVGSLMSLSAVNLGSLRQDDQTKAELTSATESIRTFTQDNEVLPTTQQAQDLITDSSISYERLSSTTYQLCTKFAGNYSGEDRQNYGINDQPINDEFVDDSYFEPKDNSRQCFEIESSALAPRES